MRSSIIPLQIRGKGVLALDGNTHNTKTQSIPDYMIQNLKYGGHRERYHTMNSPHHHVVSCDLDGRLIHSFVERFCACLQVAVIIMSIIIISCIVLYVQRGTRATTVVHVPVCT